MIPINILFEQESLVLESSDIKQLSVFKKFIKLFSILSQKSGISNQYMVRQGSKLKKDITKNLDKLDGKNNKLVEKSVSNILTKFWKDTAKEVSKLSTIKKIAVFLGIIVGVVIIFGVINSMITKLFSGVYTNKFRKGPATKKEFKILQYKCLKMTTHMTVSIIAPLSEEAMKAFAVEAKSGWLFNIIFNMIEAGNYIIANWNVKGIIGIRALAVGLHSATTAVQIACSNAGHPKIGWMIGVLMHAAWNFTQVELANTKFKSIVSDKADTLFRNESIRIN